MYTSVPTPDSGQLIADALTIVLSNEYLLYTKTRNAHWHIKGHAITDREPFFESQFKELAEIIDTVGERVRKRGCYAEAMLNAYQSVSNAVEIKFDRNDTNGYVNELLSDHNAIMQTLRANILTFSTVPGSTPTGDFLAGLIEKHDAMVLILKSRLKTQRAVNPNEIRAARFHATAEKQLIHAF